MLGLVLGLLAGAGFFIFKMDDVVNRLTSFSPSKDTVYIQKEPTDTIANREKEKKKHTANKKDTAKTMLTSAEKFASKYGREPSVRKVMAEADSLLKDTLSKDEEQEARDDIIIRKDELISARQIQIISVNKEKGLNAADSLLESISGVRNEKKMATTIMMEYWKSPINYRGYKMTKNKIVLFGMDPDISISLFHMNDRLYLIYNKSVFKLVFTDEYKQFERITDPEITGLLK